MPMQGRAHKPKHHQRRKWWLHQDSHCRTDWHRDSMAEVARAWAPSNHCFISWVSHESKTLLSRSRRTSLKTIFTAHPSTGRMSLTLWRFASTARKSLLGPSVAPKITFKTTYVTSKDSLRKSREWKECLNVSRLAWKSGHRVSVVTHHQQGLVDHTRGRTVASAWARIAWNRSQTTWRMVSSITMTLLSKSKNERSQNLI